MIFRSLLILMTLSTGACLVPGGSLMAAEGVVVPASATAIDPQVKAACERATTWLLAHQNDEGAITAGQGNVTALTALTGMSLAATGVLPTTPGAPGIKARKILEYVLRADRVDANGYGGGPDGSRMYGHGIITLYLAEMLGMSGDPAIDARTETRVRQAIEVIRWAQKKKTNRSDLKQFGGWRYTPDAGDSDLSVTVWCLLALRAAKDSGMTVEREAIDDAVGYLRACYKSDRDAAGRPTAAISACGYTPGQDPSYSTAAAGLLSLQVCGAYELPETAGSADWLMKTDIKPDMPWFFYGTYYFSQGMHQRGGVHAEYADRRLREVLLPLQESDGRWEPKWNDERNAGPVYSTAMAVLALAVHYRYLPIYQR